MPFGVGCWINSSRVDPFPENPTQRVPDGPTNTQVSILNNKAVANT